MLSTILGKKKKKKHHGLSCRLSSSAVPTEKTVPLSDHFKCRQQTAVLPARPVDYEHKDHQHAIYWEITSHLCVEKLLGYFQKAMRPVFLFQPEGVQ